MSSSSIVLYSFWRSSAAWRVRLVLALKGIKYEYKAVDLMKGENYESEYAEVNPMGGVPSLSIDGKALSQSSAIMEYLEETRPEVPLLPKDPYQRAKVRQLVETVVSDIHPIQSMRVLKKIEGEDKKAEWARHWITLGFEALEKMLAKTAGKYCFGDSITLADCVLVPQVFNAKRWEVDMSKFPIISRIDAELATHPAFKAAHPDVQPDAPKSP